MMDRKRTYREVILLFCVVLSALFLLLGVSRLLYGKRERVLCEEVSVRIEDIPYEDLEGVSAGDRVLDRGRRTILGTLVDFSTTPHTYERAWNGESVEVEKRGYCDATFRVRIEADNPRNHDAGVFYIGAGVVLSTHSFVGDGKIVSISYGEKGDA